MLRIVLHITRLNCSGTIYCNRRLIFLIYKLCLPSIVKISGFLLLMAVNLSISIIIELQTLLFLVNHLLKFEFIDHVQRHGYLQSSQHWSKSSRWVNKEVQNIVISYLHCYITSPMSYLVWRPHSIYHMNHGYYSVFHKINIRPLSSVIGSLPLHYIVM